MTREAGDASTRSRSAQTPRLGNLPCSCRGLRPADAMPYRRDGKATRAWRLAAVSTSTTPSGRSQPPPSLATSRARPTVPKGASTADPDRAVHRRSWAYARHPPSARSVGQATSIMDPDCPGWRQGQPPQERLASAAAALRRTTVVGRRIHGALSWARTASWVCAMTRGLTSNDRHRSYWARSNRPSSGQVPESCSMLLRYVGGGISSAREDRAHLPTAVRVSCCPLRKYGRVSAQDRSQRQESTQSTAKSTSSGKYFSMLRESRVVCRAGTGDDCRWPTRETRGAG